MKAFDNFRVVVMVANGNVLLVPNIPLQLDSRVGTKVSEPGDGVEVKRRWHLET
jgi:hypothetical protein